MGDMLRGRMVFVLPLQCCSSTAFPIVLQAPSNAVVLWSVPPGLRPFAVSMSIVLTHLLGDVPSPPLLGAFQGLVNNWRYAQTSTLYPWALPAKQTPH